MKVLFWLLSIFFSGVTLSNGDEVLPNDNLTSLDMGVGYDIYSGKTSNKCVERTVDTLVLIKTDTVLSGRTRLLLSQDKTMEDILDGLELGIAGKFRFGSFKASASYSAIRRKSVNRYSEYLTVGVRVEDERILLPAVRLTDSANKWASTGKDIFYRKCGNHYVSGKVIGGSLDILFSANTISESEQEETSATFGAVASWLTGGLQVDAGQKQRLEKLSSSGKLTSQIFSTGPKQNFPPLTPDSLILFARNFPDKVKRSGSWTTHYLLKSYDHLYPVIQHRDSKRELCLKYIDETVSKLVDTKSNLLYMRTNRNQFGTFSLPKLDRRVTLIDSLIRKLESIGKDCSNDSVPCPDEDYIGQLSQKVSYATPDRFKEVPLDVSHGDWQEIGTAPAGEKWVAEPLGKFWGNCRNHSLCDIKSCGEFEIRSIQSGATIQAKPTRPILIPENSKVFAYVKDSPMEDNCTYASNPIRVRWFSPLFPEDFALPEN